MTCAILKARESPKHVSCGSAKPAQWPTSAGGLSSTGRFFCVKKQTQSKNDVHVKSFLATAFLKYCGIERYICLSEEIRESSWAVSVHGSFFVYFQVLSKTSKSLRSKFSLRL